MRSEGYSSRFVCVCVCLFVCLSVCTRFNIYVVYLRSKSKVPVDIKWHLEGFWFVDFAKSVSFKSYGEKTIFFAALARSALRRVRVKSDLLDETAIEASVVVACTKGSFHKKRCTWSSSSCHQQFLKAHTQTHTQRHTHTHTDTDTHTHTHNLITTVVSSILAACGKESKPRGVISRLGLYCVSCVHPLSLKKEKNSRSVCCVCVYACVSLCVCN